MSSLTGIVGWEGIGRIIFGDFSKREFDNGKYTYYYINGIWYWILYLYLVWKLFSIQSSQVNQNIKNLDISDFTIEVQNLPPKLTTDEIKQFFKEFDNEINVYIYIS